MTHDNTFERSTLLAKANGVELRRTAPGAATSPYFLHSIREQGGHGWMRVEKVDFLSEAGAEQWLKLNKLPLNKLHGRAGRLAERVSDTPADQLGKLVQLRREADPRLSHAQALERVIAGNLTLAESLLAKIL